MRTQFGHTDSHHDMTNELLWLLKCWYNRNISFKAFRFRKYILTAETAKMPCFRGYTPDPA